MPRTVVNRLRIVAFVGLAVSLLLAAAARSGAAGAAQKESFVREVILKADDARPAGPCPVTVRFTGYVTATGPGTVKYTFSRSDGATAPVYTLDFKEAGTQTVTTTWTLGDPATLPAYDGWQALKILSPNEVESSHETGRFDVRCGAAGVDVKRPAPPRPDPPQPPGGELGANGGPRSSNGPDGGSRPLSGRFLVMLTGFTVNRQTNDNILETDGKGDEVYIVAEVAQYDCHTPIPGALPTVGFRLGSSDLMRGRGELTLRRSLVSLVMGDANNHRRIPAGHASTLGGLRTGDGYPTTHPWIREYDLSSVTVPMLLWEGELRSGRDLVIIVPTIWEWDGGNEPLRTQFTEDINSYFDYIIHPTFRAFVWRGLTGVDLFGAGDRPIGMLADGSWAPQAIMLNFETYFDTFSRTIELRYSARSEDYSLYLIVQRVED